METKTRNPLAKVDLSYFPGDIERWRSNINDSVIYTAGVRYLAEHGEAYWLLDAIASYLVPDVLVPAGEKNSRILELHFWRLNVAEDSSAILHAEADYGVVPFVFQEIEYTNFPLSEVSIWAGFDGCQWVLFLPSEY
jgi:hypothetical protein